MLAPFTLASVIIIGLYALVALISVRWLFPGLSTASKKLATVIFVAQVLVILLGMQTVHSNTYALRLFRIIGENSVGVAVAGMQLALVAEIAMLTACLTRGGGGRPYWLRLYLAGFGLLFILLTWEELRLQRLWFVKLDLANILIGAVVVAATTLVALRSPRTKQIWYLGLLIGLAVIVAGGIGIDHKSVFLHCDTLGLIHFDTYLNRESCLLNYIEESVEMLGVWLALVAMLGLFSDVVAKPNRLLRCLLYALPVATILVCVAISDPDLERVHRKIEVPPADLTFESGVRLYGYQIERDVEESNLQVSLWLSALPFGYDGLGYSIHLYDPIARSSLASRDKFVSVSGSRVRGPWHLPVFRQDLQLETAADYPRNHAFLVVLSVWRDQGDQFARLRVVSSDRDLLSDTQVVLDELVIPVESAAVAVAPLAVFDKALTLGLLDLPEIVSPAETLNLTMTWRAENEVTEDYVQFLHFGNEETGLWHVYDQEPLGARLPTRLWYSGLADSETWEIPLPDDLAPGRYQVLTGLYRASDLKRLEATDADGAPYLDARVPLGAMTIEGAEVRSTE